MPNDVLLVDRRDSDLGNQATHSVWIEGDSGLSPRARRILRWTIGERGASCGPRDRTRNCGHVDGGSTVNEDRIGKSGVGAAGMKDESLGINGVLPSGIRVHLRINGVWLGLRKPSLIRMGF